MSALEGMLVLMRRCCGVAARMAMDQVPSVSDPQLRDAFASWAAAEPRRAGSSFPQGRKRQLPGKRRRSHAARPCPMPELTR